MKRLLAAVCTFSFSLILVPLAMAETAVVNHLTLNQWVRATEDGSLKGRIVLPQVGGQVEALEGVSVAMSARNGDVLRAKSDAKGEFTIKNVAAGVYALTARGDNVFACCAMQVIPTGEALEEMFPAIAEISVSNVDYTIVNMAVIRYMPPNVKTPEVSLSTAELKGIANRVCGNDMFRVAQTDGGMTGRLHLAGAVGSELVGVKSSNVFIFKDAMQIDRTLTDETGHFSFASLEPGQYSLLAVGEGGVGLIGFELVDETALLQTSRNNRGNEALVALNQQSYCCPEFALQVAPMPEVVTCVEEVIMVETVVDAGCAVGDLACGELADGACCPVPGGGVPGYAGGGGGYGGGGGGYGGGGGGGGGLGGLGALAGLGAIAAIAANNDNNGIILPPVVASPSTP